jgi:CHAT domain-containing protein
LITLRRELRKHVECAEPRGTSSSGDALRLARALLPKGGALVVPIVATVGSKALIVAATAGDADVTIADIPLLSLRKIDEFIRGPDRGLNLAGWLGAYSIQYLPPKEYSARIHEWLSAIERLSPDLWEMFGEAVSRQLECRGVKPGARVIWLPTSALGVLPIGLAQNPANGQYLGETYEIVYAPSLDALVAAADRAGRETSASLAAAANPTGDLAFTEIETQMIASRFDPAARTVLARSSAAPEAVIAALKGKSYWHFACHGAFDWADAKQSALLLADEEPLTVGRLLENDGLGPPRLVVLSACETGLYDIHYNPDEFSGLPSAFMALGAAGVLSTTWLVDDRATALLAARFYELHLKDGLSPPAALKRAQAWLRETTRSNLIAYARRAAAERRTDSQAVAKKLELSLLRWRHEDDRFSFIGDALRKQAATGVAEHELRVRAPQGPDDTQDLPFAHPYYWGGFVFTGL